MAISRTYLCPDCNGTFSFLHHPNDEPPPDYCPLCGSDVSGKKKKKPRLSRAVTSPAIRGPKTKATDGVYRGLENSAETRRQQAAELLGVPTSRLNGMKLTDMKDNLREGDMSYVPSPAAKIEGVPVDLTRPDTGRPLGAGFGSSPVGLPGKPVREMANVMSSISTNHQRMIQATVASGKKS